MKVVAYMGHPAHFHMLKHPVEELRASGADVGVLARPKDVLDTLLRAKGWEYTSVLPSGRPMGGKIGEWVTREARTLGIVRRMKPDVLIGTSAEIAHVGRLLGRPSIVLSEDDYSIIPKFARVTYPFASVVCCPEVCDAGPWEYKKIGYRGFQKLSYLHPCRFTPQREKVRHLLDGGRFSIVRMVSLTAHHDVGIRGLDRETVREAVRRLEQRGSVYLSTEGPLPPEFQDLRLPLPPEDIHHALAFADVYLGDSQSMAVEAAILGTPALRFSDFAGQISVLETLEHRYGLTYGVHTEEPATLLRLIDKLTAMPGLRDEWARRRNVMLGDVIDVTAFWTWLIREVARASGGARLERSLLESLRYGAEAQFQSDWRPS